jgi:hypothetical protein
MDRTELIARYASAVEEVVAALEGLDEDALDRRPAPEEWTAREIIHHLADSETMSAIRLRTLLAQDSPTIWAYPEAQWATALPYDRPIDTSLALLKAVRAASHSILVTLTDDQWDRAGQHPEHDEPYTVAKWLEIYVEHPREHAEQIRQAVLSGP